MLVLLCALLAQTIGGGNPPTFPARAFNPHLIDPGLDGGRYRWFQNGELTPDGRLLIAFRNPADPTDPTFQGNLFRSALVATVVHPERMLKNGNGHLDGFYQTNWPVTNPFGFDFTLGRPIEPLSPGEPAESRVIYYGYPVVPFSSSCGPNEPYCFRPVCSRPSNSVPPALADGFRLDFPNFPLPNEFGNAHMTFTLTPREKGNPFPSNADGTENDDGLFTTYKIWLVRTHSAGYEGVNAAGEPNLVCKTTSGELIQPNPTTNPALKPFSRPEFVAQNVTVVLDQDENIVLTSVETPYQTLFTYQGAKINGIEPSITSDGRLIVFHGNGDDPNFAAGDANVTYIFNPTPCSPTGWTPPRSITQLPLSSELAGISLLNFKLFYKLFLHPIRITPAGASTPWFELDGADTVRGTYPWVSKDGSFFIATCTVASEAKEFDPCVPSSRVRAGGYACGQITGGYVKHIDDVGINPTRKGGPWLWTRYSSPDSCADFLQNSWRALTFSTGIKPGPWEPFFGKGAVIPTQFASERIPVLSVFESEIDSYGEVRFEEADGSYLLYLACNESFVVNPTTPGEVDVTFDVHSTPDTSGRHPRARCTLNSGAAFPQEVLSGGSTELRASIGTALANGGPLHENVGFKGQGIVFNPEGRVDVLDAEGLAGKQRFTLQAFVKVLDTPTAARWLIEYGRDDLGTRHPLVTLKLNAQGKFKAAVEIEKSDGTTQVVQPDSRFGTILPGESMFHPGLGWRHVALTFDGDAGGTTKLCLYLDGQLEKQMSVLTTSVVYDPAGTEYYIVGPGRNTPDPVDEGNRALILDEVAVSDTVRTIEELRRDAYVVPLTAEFGEWPSGAPSLPQGLVAEEAKWPLAVPYDQNFVNLGQALFGSDDLSHLDLQPRRSCKTCHEPTTAFVIPDQDKPLDVNGVKLAFNAPTLLNAAFSIPKFFDGRAISLEDQVLRPILTGPEMGKPVLPTEPQTIGDVLGRLSDEFAAFSVPATQANLVKALSMYVRAQVSGGSRFDTHQSLPDFPAFLRGQALFFGKAGCFHCHRGSNFSDDEFHNVFTVKTTETISGRSDATGRAVDDGRLKTPTLRNLSLTGPYFHDGSAASLTAVVNHYSLPFVAGRVGVADRHLRPLFLTTNEKSDLVAFLESLAP